MNLMKKLGKQLSAENSEESSNSKAVLEEFFIHSLQEMYYAENAISEAFANIVDKIVSPKLLEILKIHFAIHLKHKERLEKIFILRNKKPSTRVCKPMKALLSQTKNHLSIFGDDRINWEIALILVAQKLAYYKIASYGGLAHLAINLEFRNAAALLAFSVQEEEEFIANHLNRIFDAFLASHVEEYKN